MRFTILILICLPFLAYSQQLADRSNFNEIGFVWNPAMTAAFDYWELAAVHRETWTGFGEAPRTTTIATQYPFVKNNMSVGGYFQYDDIAPLTTSTLGFSYAYKLRFGPGKSNQLALGVSAGIAQYNLQSNDYIVNHEDDEYIPTAVGLAFQPNFGAGVFYSFNPRGDKDRLYYIGAGVNQILNSKLDFEEDNSLANFQRALHGNALMGARLIRDEFVLEPSLWVNYSQGGIADATIGLKLEGSESFIAGLAYSTNNTLSLQVGGIIINPFQTYGDLRFGLLAGYNVGTFGQFRDLGYEFYLGYRYEL